MKTNQQTVFLVDDDAVFLKLLAIDFQMQTNFKVLTFETGEKCIENLQLQPDLIILDYHLDGVEKGVMNGIETLDKIKDFNTAIPVIMLSSQDKIEVAIDCMHHKAHDYIVKSETAFLKLQNNIQSIFNFKQVEKKLNWYMDRM
jgi:two-component system OmpR family response regulator